MATKTNLRIESFKESFPIGSQMHYNDVYLMNKKGEPKMKPSTNNWFVYTLLALGIIMRVAPGIFKRIK